MPASPAIPLIEHYGTVMGVFPRAVDTVEKMITQAYGTILSLTGFLMSPGDHPSIKAVNKAIKDHIIFPILATDDYNSTLSHVPEISQRVLFCGLEDSSAVLDEDGNGVIESVLWSGNTTVSLYIEVTEVELTNDLVGEKREAMEKLMDEAVELAGIKRKGGSKCEPCAKRARKDEGDDSGEDDDSEEDEEPRFMTVSIKVKFDK